MSLIALLYRETARSLEAIKRMFSTWRSPGRHASPLQGMPTQSTEPLYANQPARLTWNEDDFGILDVVVGPVGGRGSLEGGHSPSIDELGGPGRGGPSRGGPGLDIPRALSPLRCAALRCSALGSISDVISAAIC